MHGERKKQNTRRTVAFVGGSIMLWGYMASLGVGNPVKVNDRTNPSHV